VQPSTVIRHGNRTFSFADLRVGDHVIVKGSRNGATVTATEIKVSQGGEDDDDDDGDDDNETEVRGTISLLIGTCPGLTFMVAGTPVVTNAATRFEDGACSTLAQRTCAWRWRAYAGTTAPCWLPRSSACS
jgi:hypothetical protein